jgi:hypothetical protein
MSAFEIHNRRHTAKRTQNCRENPLLAAQILHAQLLEIFAVSTLSISSKNDFLSSATEAIFRLMLRVFQATLYRQNNILVASDAHGASFRSSSCVSGWLSLSRESSPARDWGDIRPQCLRGALKNFAGIYWHPGLRSSPAL